MRAGRRFGEYPPRGVGVAHAASGSRSNEFGDPYTGITTKVAGGKGTGGRAGSTVTGAAAQGEPGGDESAAGSFASGAAATRTRPAAASVQARSRRSPDTARRG